MTNASNTIPAASRHLRDASHGELTETELDHVSGGKPGAAAKEAAAPKESITLSYGAIQWAYTP
jgi:bacteriocin-like protein